ncbi:MAG: hydrogenase maturation nickel metallochaperone HypA [Lachnospira sp.]
MHELGIVMQIIKTVEETAKENDAASVASVTLEVGNMSGIIPSYMQDCWNMAINSSELLQNCSLIIEEIPLKMLLNIKEITIT